MVSAPSLYDGEPDQLVQDSDRHPLSLMSLLPSVRLLQAARDTASHNTPHHRPDDRVSSTIRMPWPLPACPAGDHDRICPCSRRLRPAFHTRYGVIPQDTGLGLRGNLHRADHGGSREITIRDNDEINRSNSRRMCFPSKMEIQRPLPGTDRIRDPDRGETFYP